MKFREMRVPVPRSWIIPMTNVSQSRKVFKKDGQVKK